MAYADTHHRPYSDSMKVKFETTANANVYFVRMYLQCAVLVSVNLHVAVTVSVQWCEHDAEGSSPMTEEHEQTVSQWLLRKYTPSLVYCRNTIMRSVQVQFQFSYLFQGLLTLWPAAKRPCLCVPGTFCMMLATRALKWERMSLSVSESLSFSASRSCRVRSTYSSRVLFREWDSPSRPPLALHRQSTN